jgi:hypothetical protein
LRFIDLLSTAAPAQEKCDPVPLPSICTNSVVAAKGAMNGLTWERHSDAKPTKTSP